MYVKANKYVVESNERYNISQGNKVIQFGMFIRTFSAFGSLFIEFVNEQDEVSYTLSLDSSGSWRLNEGIPTDEFSYDGEIGSYNFNARDIDPKLTDRSIADLKQYVLYFENIKGGSYKVRYNYNITDGSLHYGVTFDKLVISNVVAK